MPSKSIGPDGLIAGKTQTGYILALHFDLVPKQLKAVTFAALVKEVEARDRHLSTGFVGTPYLCQVLCDGGRLDLAYALLLQRTYPSWLYSVRHGATTIWERWDGWTKEGGFQDPRMNSFNHYAYGAIGAWIVETIAGIRPKPKYPGYKHFHLQPGFPIFSLEKGEDRITWANAEYQSPYGLIKSHWQMGEGCIDWQVVIPPNTTATVLIPDHVRSPVLVDNIPLADAKGITLLKLERSGLLLGLQSGSYNFHIDIMSRRGN